MGKNGKCWCIYLFIWLQDSFLHYTIITYPEAFSGGK